MHMVEPLDDAELLTRYAQARDEAAFAGLVRRYLALVYHAARRQVGDTHRAEEITQEVFTRLARKAPGLTAHTSLAGWLHATTRHAALESLRAERRRRTREREAFLMNEAISGGRDPEWERIRPALDEALGELATDDREVVLWRYFLGLSWRDIGARLGAAENTARMRGDRALERLQGRLAKRGLTSTAAILSAGFAAEASASVPVSLANTVTQGALTSVTSVVVGGLAGFTGFMSASKLVCTAGIVVLGLVGIATWQQSEVRLMKARAINAKDELARIRGALRTAEAGVVRAERAVADLDGKLATPAPATEEVNAPWDPLIEGNALMARYPALQREVLARADAINAWRYGAWLREADLTPEQTAKFYAIMRHNSSISSPAGPKGEMYVFSADDRMTTAEANAAMKELLGPAYERMPKIVMRNEARESVGSLANRLTFSDTPLSGAQAQQLVELMMSLSQQPDGRFKGFDWSAISASMESILSPAQREVWAQVAANRQERRKNMRVIPESGGKK